MNQDFFLYVAMPMYFVAILAEYFYGYRKHNKAFDWHDGLLSLWYGIAGAVTDTIMKGTCFLVLDYLSVVSPFRVAAFDTYPVISWALLFIAQDFCFYWLHRTEHQSRVFWAVHSNHHSSPQYNFFVALRSSVLQPVYRFIFYVPAALLGFDGISIMFMYAVNQFYQFWLHTETIGRLPRPVEFFFVTPSHHRVHHASNVLYLDRNMGQVLIIWDRLFGTFQKQVEEEKPVFGLTKPLESYNPVTSIFTEFSRMKKDLAKSSSWRDKISYIFKAPGWSHDGSSLTAEELRRMEREMPDEEQGDSKLSAA